MTKPYRKALLRNERCYSLKRCSHGTEESFWAMGIIKLPKFDISWQKKITIWNFMNPGCLICLILRKVFAGIVDKLLEKLLRVKETDKINLFRNLMTMYVFTQPLHTSKMWPKVYFKRGLTGLHSVFLLDCLLYQA